MRLVQHVYFRVMNVAQLMQDLEFLTMQITAPSEQPVGELKQEDNGLGKLCMNCQCFAALYGCTSVQFSLVRMKYVKMQVALVWCFCFTCLTLY